MDETEIVDDVARNGLEGGNANNVRTKTSNCQDTDDEGYSTQVLTGINGFRVWTRCGPNTTPDPVPDPEEEPRGAKGRLLAAGARSRG